MGTTAIGTGVAEALLGKVRSRVLALLFAHADQAFYLREVVRRTGLAHGAVQRELALLLRLGLLTRTQRGRQVYHQANRQSPVFPELRGLMLKTVAMGDALRAALDSLGERVSVAFVYGSFARGEENAGSDVDLLLIAEVSARKVAAVLGPVGREIGRELNTAVYQQAEFQERVERGDHFITEVLNSPKVFLIGDEHELDRLASRAEAATASQLGAGDQGAAGGS